MIARAKSQFSRVFLSLPHHNLPRSTSAKSAEADLGIIRCRDWVFASERRAGRAIERAEDVAQAVALRLTEWPSETGYQPGNWLRKIACQCSLEMERKQLVLTSMQADQLQDDSITPDPLDAAQVMAALNKLQGREFSAVLLCDAFGLRAREVAQDYGLKPAHLQVLRQRGRDRLRTCLRKGFEGTLGFVVMFLA